MVARVGTPSLRRLIVNADDFGFTSGVNRAIVEAHTHGVVTSSTLMADSPAFAGATEVAKTLPPAERRCHVVLIDGEPLLGAEQNPSLTTRTAAPRFRDGLMTFAARAIADHNLSEFKNQPFGSLAQPSRIQASLTSKARHLFTSYPGVRVPYMCPDP